MRLVEQDPCFLSAMPDEPAYVLLARDASAPKLLREWAAIRQSLISAGLKPKSDQRQIDETYALADRMEAWRRDAEGAWRDQPQLAFPPVSDGYTLDTFGAGVHADFERFPNERDPLAGQHSATRQSDEYFCSKCSKRWGVDENAPDECTPLRREAMDRVGEV